ncbi:MAG: zinc ABC transporter substrate-binding protein [Armatimonadetes bacterium]|nr:zinc ABC transporter substrate-binding protein [Armatimonadota bacterium]
MYFRLIAVFVIFAVVALPAAGKVDVVASAPNLADIAKSIGGNLVSVTSLARPSQDIHFVEPRPSFVAGLRNADMVIVYGMGYDLWTRPLIDNARNKKIVPGGPGYVDASLGIQKLEVPKGKIDMSMGELHPLGNPHYFLDPQNARAIARNIMGGLIRVSPKDEDTFRENYTKFTSQLNTASEKWEQTMAPHRGKKVVTYHKSWIYFLKRFGLVEFDNVEPKPGISPSPSHVSRLIANMKRENVKLIIMEPYYPSRFPDMIAKQTGGKVLQAPISVGDGKIDNYIELMETITKQIAEGLR